MRVCVSPPPAQLSPVEETSTQREWEPGALASRAVKEGGESRKEGGGWREEREEGGGWRKEEGEEGRRVERGERGGRRVEGEGSKVRVGGQLGLDYNAITGG